MNYSSSKTVTGDSPQHVSELFETAFLGVPLEKQIEHCDSYELVPLFKRWLPENQPILEAGSGSGRWVAWFLKHDWQAVGLDWSETLNARARAAISGARFESGDMRAMPFKNEEFGAVVALGSIEHVSEGPEAALREFNRVLRPNGIAIITVPYMGAIRKRTRVAKTLFLWAKAATPIRRLFRKAGWNGRSLKEARKGTVLEWAPVFVFNESGWDFFEYEFTKEQMRNFLSRNGFSIIEEFIAFGDEGVLHNFGPLVGKFDYNKAVVVFSLAGKILRRLIPIHLVGHMLCYVVRRI